MLHIVAILSTIGINSVGCIQTTDPETEEEFKQNFICDATWEEYVVAREKYFRILGERRIRQHRDRLLVETDWVESNYSQSTIANLEEWNTYRQYLRDLPSQIDKLKWIRGMPDFSSLNIPSLPKTIRKGASSVENM